MVATTPARFASCLFLLTGVAMAAPKDKAALRSGAGFCGPECVFCWFGTPEEGNCDDLWCGDGLCDCGCQFTDSDCPGGTCGNSGCGMECDFCWFGEPEENNCPLSWCNDETCDCGCQFTDSDCPGGSCGGLCGPQCAQCWLGTSAENDCPISWCGDGECDCGCQFSDSDCPGGACDNLCGNSCDFCWYEDAHQGRCPAHWCGDGICDCGCQFTDSDCPGGSCPPSPCGPQCLYCWVGGIEEDTCDPKWCGDGECDCGCQFTDTDCGGTCGPNCPAGSITWQNPFSGAVDARWPHVPQSPNIPEGFYIFLLSGPAGISFDCLSLCEQSSTVDPNAIHDFFEEAPSEYLLTLHRRITPGATTTLTYTPSSGAASVGVFTFHPGNVNGDTVADAADVTDLAVHLGGTPRGLPLWQCDIDHSGTCAPPDLIAVIDLLNGAGPFVPWNGTALPSAACP